MQILTKNFNNFQVRILLIDNKEYFVAKDVAEVLKYKVTRKAISDHCLFAISLSEFFNRSEMDRLKLSNLFGNNYKNLKLIQEPDVWRLIIRSNLSEAVKIEKWIFEEVLPSIRKTGKYELENSKANQPAKTPQTFDLDSYISENEKLIKLIKLITSEDQITLHYLDKLTKQLNLKSPLDLLQIDLNSFYFIPTELGKFFNKSAIEVNKILESKGFQEKINGVWSLTETGKNYAIQLDNNFLTIKWKLQSLI